MFFLHLTKMTDALTSKGFGDFEGERSENRLMMLRYREVMSWLCIIDDSSPGRAVGELGSDALVSGKWCTAALKCVYVTRCKCQLRFLTLR